MKDVLLHGDCLALLKTLEDNSVDALCCDPPSGIAFMGQAWDKDKGGRDQWIAWLSEVMREALRVVKPGGHALVWALPRTSHWTATALEDSGWSIRDIISHLQGQGFPKSKNLGNGIGSALKPSVEHWILARKPLAAANLASNVLAWGTGGLNIDASRVGNDAVVTRAKAKGNSFTHVGSGQGFNGCPESWHAGRWPPNFLLSHSEQCTKQSCDESCAVCLLDEQAGERKSGYRVNPSTKRDQHQNAVYGKYQDTYTVGERGYDDAGGVSRFFPVFYAAKASRRDRSSDGAVNNIHPTCKNTELMKWLIRLVTPPNGTVLDCFAGSGSTLVACVQEGFHFIGIEQDASYVTIAQSRVAHAQREQRPAKPRAKIVRLPKRPQRAEQLALFA